MPMRHPEEIATAELAESGGDVLLDPHAQC
jgi:hypothetical protein